MKFPCISLCITRHLGCLALAGTVFCQGLVVHAAESLLPNGGFEDEGGPDLPEGWTNLVDGRKNLPGMYVTGKPGSETHTGRHAVKLLVSSESEATTADRRLRNTWVNEMPGGKGGGQAVELEKGKTYRFSFWSKREDFDDPDHALVGECKGIPPGSRSEYTVLGRSEHLTGSSSWEKSEIIFEVPQDALGLGLQIVFRLFHKGPIPEGAKQPTVWIDDVEVVPVP